MVSLFSPTYTILTMLANYAVLYNFAPNGRLDRIRASMSRLVLRAPAFTDSATCAANRLPGRTVRFDRSVAIPSGRPSRSIACSRAAAPRGESRRRTRVERRPRSSRPYLLAPWKRTFRFPKAMSPAASGRLGETHSHNGHRQGHITVLNGGVQDDCGAKGRNSVRLNGRVGLMIDIVEFVTAGATKTCLGFQSHVTLVR